MLGRGLKNIKEVYSLMSSPFSCPLHSRPSAGLGTLRHVVAITKTNLFWVCQGQWHYGWGDCLELWKSARVPECHTGSPMVFVCHFLHTALSTAIFLVELEVCRNRNTSFWWSSVGQQINAIDVDNMGGPPGSPAGFVEIKQVFLPRTHFFIRKLVSGCIQFRI